MGLLLLTQSVGDGVIIRDNKGQVGAALSKNLPILLGPIVQHIFWLNMPNI